MECSFCSGSFTLVRWHTDRMTEFTRAGLEQPDMSMWKIQQVGKVAFHGFVLSFPLVIRKCEFGRPNSWIDRISTSVENNETTLGIFLDLTKAFDTIDHDTLLYKLQYYGFRGSVLNWFEDYLRNRKQYVYYNGHKSTHKNISCGVPQRSILGPLLSILLFLSSYCLQMTLQIYSHTDI